MTRTLVIGGTGFIGSRVVQRLAADGRSVRCLARTTSRTDRLDNLPVERTVGDLRDTDSLIRAASGCSSIIHLGGISAWSEIDSPDMFPVVVEGTRNVLRAALEQKVTRVVYVSSAAAMGPHDRPEPRNEVSPFSERSAVGMRYVLAKRQAERLCREAEERGMETVIVRPAEVYGSGDRDMITASNLVGLLKSSPVVVCAGGTSVVHIDDVAHGIVRALDQGRAGETYLLGGDNLLHHELAGLLLELMNRRTSIISLPGPLLRVCAAAARVFRLPFPIPPAVVPYATRYWFVDNRKARTELGLHFRSARETLTETLTWLKTLAIV